MIKSVSNLMALTLSACILHASTAAAEVDPVGTLPGRWSGWGSVLLDSGATEKVKCIATYFLENGQSNIRQNLRCASPSYKIDVVSNLTLKAGQLTGNWSERTHSQTGSVTGRVDPGGFNISVLGQTFTATMAVGTSTCKQSITINPKGFQISKISINLTKC